MNELLPRTEEDKYMSTTVNLTEQQQAWINEQVKAQGLKDVDAYISRLLEAEQKRQAVEKLVNNLEEADASGSHEVTDEMWEERQQRVALQFRKANKQLSVK